MSKYANSGTITSQTAGAEVLCSGNTLLSCEIGGTATAAFQIKRPDGTWLPLQTGGTTAVTGGGMWQIAFPHNVTVRLNVSAYTSGDVDWQIISSPPVR